MDYSDLDKVTWPYQLTKAVHRDLYPALEPSKPELSAEGKKVIITGVSGGVGSAIAEAWAVAGAAGIVITGRKLDALNEVAARVNSVAESSSCKILVKPADITSESSVQDLYSKAREEFGTIDVLINNAGTMNYAPIGRIEPSQWWNDYEVNVKGTYLMCHYFLRQANGKGSIITIGSGAAGNCYPNMSSYASSKLAQTKLMQFVHAENPDVRAFTLLPGLVKTSMTAEVYLPFARDDPMLTGAMSLFLCTPRAEWMRGGVMSVNWDIEEMEAHKEEIQQGALNSLAYLNAKLGKGGHPWST